MCTTVCDWSKKSQTTPTVLRFTQLLHMYTQHYTVQLCSTVTINRKNMRSNKRFDEETHVTNYSFTTTRSRVFTKKSVYPLIVESQQKFSANSIIFLNTIVSRKKNEKKIVVHYFQLKATERTNNWEQYLCFGNRPEKWKAAL